MAAENWPSLRAARLRAKTLVDKLDLTPPVDIKALLMERAYVEYVDWSHECDAVTELGPVPSRVFIRSDLPRLRERFTFAHELGHIELAWHVGTVDCHVDPTVTDESAPVVVRNGLQEREANEFASRLLAPDRWLSPLVRKAASFERAKMQELLDALTAAEMSALAGLISLSKHLLPGHALFVDEAFAISPGTAWPGNPPISESDVERYLENAVTVEEFLHQGRKVLWGLTIPQPLVRVDTQVLVSDARTPHQILMDCCTRMFGGDLAHAKAMSINGVVGGMTRHVDLHWHADAIAAVVQQRIESTSELKLVLTDPEFHVYLHKKAHAIVARRASSVAEAASRESGS